jgi:hypothetical protein
MDSSTSLKLFFHFCPLLQAPFLRSSKHPTSRTCVDHLTWILTLEKIICKLNKKQLQGQLTTKQIFTSKKLKTTILIRPITFY